MILLLRCLVALAIGLITDIFGVVAAFFLVGHFGGCPSTVRTCDLPMIGGFGMGLMAGLTLGVLAAWTCYRWLGRALAAPPSRAP